VTSRRRFEKTPAAGQLPAFIITIIHPSSPLMKFRPLRLIVALAFIGSSSAIFASEVIEDAMKKYHKAPEGTDPTCKKISAGTASDAEIADVLKAYQAMCAEAPPKGEKSAWVEKCQALIAAVKKIQAKDAAGVGEYKKAVNCKACHTSHKP
jgi:hypothetical protein